MAEEAFALSPISARAALPSEEDYAAISEAFMETSRGRWFLGEYAKRNRNADTRMVLDAVARIEQTVAAQKQAASDTRLTDALAAIRQAVGVTQAATHAALDGMALEEQLAPIRKGVRVIREISWRLREIGADGRICDILDSQVGAIETSTDHIASAKPQPAVDAAFAGLLDELAAFEARDEAEAKGPHEVKTPHEAKAPEADARVVPFPSPAEAAPVAAIETAKPEPPPQQVEAPAAAVETPMAAMEALAEAMQAPAEAVQAPTEAMALSDGAEPVAHAAEIADEATAEALDEAVLDLIAAEMSAPEPDGFEEDFEAAAEVASTIEPAPLAPAPDFVAAPSIAAETSAPQTATVEIEIPAAPQPVASSPESVQPEPVRSGPAGEISLGATIIASGMLRKPNLSANDPLAPIRRMSQAERIAFFS